MPAPTAMLAVKKNNAAGKKSSQKDGKKAVKKAEESGEEGQKGHKEVGKDEGQEI